MGKNRYKKILKHLRSEEIDQKINLLNEKMTTVGLYQQGDTLTIPPVLDEWDATFPDGPEGPTITGGGGAKLSSDGSFGMETSLEIRRRYPKYTKNNGVYPYVSTGYWSWIWVSVSFAANWGNRTNSFGEKYGVTPGGRYIQGYYTSLSAIDPRLIAGGSRIHESDPALGYKVYYWPNDYPATTTVSGARRVDDPNFLPVLSKDRGNIKGTNPWDKVKDMLDAGKEWMDKMFGERIKGKLDKIKELLKPLSEKALRGLEDVLQFTEDKFEEFIGDSIERSIGMGSAALTLTTFFDHQEGNVNYNKNNPYEVLYGPSQKQNISNAFDNALNYIDNMGFDIRGKIDRGEKFTQQEIDFLNQKMNYDFGSTSPEGFGFYRTFGKFSPNVQITKNSKGGYDITDNYVFTDLDDFDGGNIEIGNLKLGPGVKGKYYAEKDKGDVDFFDSDGPDKKRIGSLKQMYITTSLPAASPVKEELTLEDIERQLILEELEYDYLIRKLSRIDVEEKIVKENKTIKRVSSAVNDPSPILEKKTIQTERKSPNRFLVKEKKEDTSRTKWLKRA